MKKKYNLALIPQTISDKVIACAQPLGDIKDTYILGKNSLPHVTLYHFWWEEDEIESLWKNVCKIWHEKAIHLQFDQFSFLTFYKNIYWISLLPNKMDELHKMHKLIADVIQQPIKEHFDPHMTLLNTKISNEQEVERVSKNYSPLADNFILALGACDEVGQLTELIYSK